MRAGRLLSLLIHLQLNERVSASRLAREFGVSKRTIYRDIDALTLSGIPVYAEPGRDRGFSLLHGFRTRLTGLSEDEALGAALLRADTVAADFGLQTAARDASRKLIASLPAGAQARAAHIAARLHVDPAGWYADPMPPSALALLKEAVLSDRMVRFAYSSWTARTRPMVSPLGLVLKAERWYLVANARSGPRTYRVDGMQEVEVLDRPAVRPKGFDLAEHWRASTAAFRLAMQDSRALVHITPVGIATLEAARNAALVPAPTPLADRPGWLEASIALEDSPHGVREVLQLGPEIDVRKPASLRAAVATAAQALLALHGG